MLLQLRFETQQNIRLWIGDHVGNGEIRKVREKKWGSRASPTLLLSSIRSLFFHVRSVANLHHLVAWNRLAKRWQTNQARVVRLCFMAALLPQIWNIYYDMSSDVDFADQKKLISIASVKNRRQTWRKCRLSPAAGCYFEPWFHSYIVPPIFNVPLF